MKCQECTNEIPYELELYGVTLCKRCQAEMVLIEENKDLKEQLAKIPTRTKKLIDNDIPFMVVRCDEPYANEVARLVKEQATKDGTWTNECQDWMNSNGINLDQQ